MAPLCFWNFLMYLVLSISLRSINGSIHKNVKYYDILHASDLSHKIIKKGLQESNHPFNKIKEITFKTLGKHFRLILTPKKGILHSKFQATTVDADGNEKPVVIDQEEFYDGRLFGENESTASVHISDGVMMASIHTPEETYHIEPSWRHLPHLGYQSMVAYRSSDVKLSWEHAHEKPVSPCGYVKEEFNTTDNNVDDEEPDTFDEDPSALPHSRSKRQVDPAYEYKPTKTRCPLLLVADYRFYQEMGGSNTKTTINYLISLIDRVHKIYNDTIWHDRSEQDGYRGMGFVIKKIVVHAEANRVRGGEAHYNMIRDKWDVRNLLESTSKMAIRST